MECPKCGAENSDEVRYCGLCQAPFETPAKSSASPSDARTLDPFRKNRAKAAKNEQSPELASSEMSSANVGGAAAYQANVGPIIHDEVITSEERTWAALAHVANYVVGLLGPIIIYLIYRKKSVFVADQAKEAINFQISIGVYAIILVMLALFINKMAVYFLIAIFAIALYALVISIFAAVRTYGGNYFRYPFSFSLL